MLAKKSFVLGYPLTSTMGDEIKLTTGVISSKLVFKEMCLYIKFQHQSNLVIVEVLCLIIEKSYRYCKR